MPASYRKLRQKHRLQQEHGLVGITNFVWNMDFVRSMAFVRDTEFVRTTDFFLLTMHFPWFAILSIFFLAGFGIKMTIFHDILCQFSVANLLYLQICCRIISSLRQICCRIISSLRFAGSGYLTFFGSKFLAFFDLYLLLKLFFVQVPNLLNCQRYFSLEMSFLWQNCSQKHIVTVNG